MSAEVFLVGQPGGNDASVHGTTVGGNKPLHRFLRGQPKIIGIIKLVVGSSMCSINFGVSSGRSLFSRVGLESGFLAGALFIICGILYILTEYNPTKRTVTISLALSIVAILGACWTLLHMIPSIIYHHMYYIYYADYSDDEFRTTDEPQSPSYSAYQGTIALEVILLFYTIVVAITVVVMSVRAVAALLSSKSQAIIVMTTAAAEEPVQ